jgi:hypothetical protein
MFVGRVVVETLEVEARLQRSLGIVKGSCHNDVVRARAASRTSIFQTNHLEIPRKDTRW